MGEPEGRAVSRPRVLFVGRNRYRLPLPEWLARKWSAIGDQLDYRVLGAAEPGSPLDNGRFALSPPAWPRRLDGPLFYLRLPFRLRRAISTFRPDVVVASDPFVGAAALAGRALVRPRPKVIVEVHGDWRTFARLYGSPARRLVAPAADRLSVCVLRRADATRAVSAFTAVLVEESRGVAASDTFPAYIDHSVFTAEPITPLPDRPTALFVGALEAYKNIDGLAAAWRRVAAALPVARLVVVGTGARRAVIEQLVRDLPGRVEHHAQLEPHEVARMLDEATVLVLPSWPEGLGRVVIEAFARGRGVVATNAGGIPDLVTNGVEGILVPRADTDALVEALTLVLTDRALAEQLGAAAHARYADWQSTPESFAAQMRALVDRTLSGTAG